MARSHRREPRSPRAYYRHQADAIYALQMREHVMRRLREGYTAQQIATELGQSVATIHAYRRQAVSRAITRYRAHMNGEPDPVPGPVFPHGVPTGSGPGPQRPRSPKAPVEVLDAPDARLLQKACLELRKSLVPFDEMAERLGISEQEAKAYTAAALRRLNESETTNAELERRLMVEQLDEMLRAVRPYALGSDERAPILDAVDRVIKLLAQKSKLLGLDQMPAVDITLKLQEIATEANYDIREVEDIARDVLARHRLTVPSSLFARPAESSAEPSAQPVV